MSHCINNNIRSEADTHVCVGKWVAWIIGPLPAVAQIVVECDEHHESIVVVEYTAPMRCVAVGAIGDSASLIRLPIADLHLARQVVHRVENWMIVGQIDDHPVGEDSLHPFDKAFPFACAKKAVAEEKAA